MGDKVGQRAACQTLPGLPRAVRPSGRFVEGKTPQSAEGRLYETYFCRNVRQVVTWDDSESQSESASKNKSIPIL